MHEQTAAETDCFVDRVRENRTDGRNGERVHAPVRVCVYA